VSSTGFETSAEVTDDTLLAYKEVRSFAVHSEAEPPVALEQASDFERAVRETFDQYLTVAKKRGFTKRRQLLQLLDNYGPGRPGRLDPRTRQRRVGQVPRQHHGQFWAGAEARAMMGKRIHRLRHDGRSVRQ
jgi:hypothetical protein